MMHSPATPPNAYTRLDEYRVTVRFNAVGPTGLYHMRLHFDAGRLSGAPHAPRPGQFMMLDIQDDRDFRFRRPFSLMSWNPDTQEGDVIYKIVGEGTQRMAQWQEGDQSLVLSSLGVAFDDFKNIRPKRTLMLAGGVGLAPLLLWAEAGRQQDWQDDEMPTLIFGVRCHEEVKPLMAHLSTIMPLDKLILCTDDGSFGFHGNVVQWMDAHIEQVKYNYENILVCGPNPMMAASVKKSYELLPEAQVLVSLENHMPCGTGACYGCVVGQSEGRPPVKVCEVGPVLEASRVCWDTHGPTVGAFVYEKGVYPHFSADTVASMTTRGQG